MNNLDNLTDKQLMDAYFKGDSEAISLLVDRHRVRILNYIHVMVKDRDMAEDILQDTFIKAVRFLDEGRYAESGKFLPWVLRIAHNQVIDYFRQNKIEYRKSSISSEGPDVLNHPRFSELNAEQLMENSEVEHMLRELIDTLPAEQKQVVQMRYYSGMSFKEIAEETNVSINTALGRMRYALMNLRKNIDDNRLSMT